MISNSEHISYSGVLYLCIIDHNLIYAIRKINTKPPNESHSYIEYRDFKKFKVSNFLNDLYEIPWVDIRNKADVDGMWEIWKTLFVCSINMYPFDQKEKKRNIPSLNREVKAK